MNTLSSHTCGCNQNRNRRWRRRVSGRILLHARGEEQANVQSSSAFSLPDTRERTHALEKDVHGVPLS
jgi:hypothetical protein